MSAVDVHGELTVRFDADGHPRFSSPHQSQSLAVDDVARAILGLEQRIDFLRRWLESVRRGGG